MVPLNRSMFNKSFTQKYCIKKLIPLLHYYIIEKEYKAKKIY